MIDLRAGHVLDVLPQMKAEGVKVRCVVTSPPYWGLRAYGTEPQIWANGHALCVEHDWFDTTYVRNNDQTAGKLQRGNKGSIGRDEPVVNGVCSACGAWRGELGLEPTPELYVEHLVQVFRAVWDVLADDGTLWLNLGDSFAGGKGQSGTRGADNQEARNERGESLNRGYQTLGGAKLTKPTDIRSNVGNALYSIIERGILFLGGRNTLTITAKSENVLRANNLAPDTKLTRFLGVKRIVFKKRDNDFCQVLNLLDAECDIWIGRAVSFVAIDDATIQIFVNESDSLRVVVSNDDLNTDSTLGVSIGARAAEQSNMPFAVKEPTKPEPERTGYIQPAGDTVSFDTSGKGVLQIDAVNQSVTLTDALVPNIQGLRDFRVTKASEQHFALSLMGGIVEFACRCVGHLFVSNSFGSLVRYGELYDKAKRKANAQQPKQEIGIPEMVKRALMEDGWICRSTIIWHKPNPMPESVRDRTTKAHEFIFLFSKSPKYFYDYQAILEPANYDGRKDTKMKGSKKYPNGHAPEGTNPNTLHLKGHERWSRKMQGTNYGGDGTGLKSHSGSYDKEIGEYLGHITGEGIPARNKRSVWTVTTKPYKGAHFATFSPELIEPCILAGSAVGDIVLDPFGGSGTVAEVALKHGRDAILIELKPDYVELQKKRLEGVQAVLS